MTFARIRPKLAIENIFQRIVVKFSVADLTYEKITGLAKECGLYHVVLRTKDGLGSVGSRDSVAIPAPDPGTAGGMLDP